MNLISAKNARFMGRSCEPALVRSLRGQTPSIFAFSAGRKCTLACPHCISESSPERTESADPKIAGRLIEAIRPLLEKGKVLSIVVSGGEPLLYPDYIDAVVTGVCRVNTDLPLRLQRKHMPRLEIITNGTIRDRETLRKLERISAYVRFIISEDVFHANKQVIEKTHSAMLCAGLQVEPLGYRPAILDTIAGFGCAYQMTGLPNAMKWWVECRATNIGYELDRTEVRVVKSYEPNCNDFMVDEIGRIYLCGAEAISIGDLTQEPLIDIVDRIKRDERITTLLRDGPLGLARLHGVLDQAVELLSQLGICGVCYALANNLLH